MIDWRLGCVCGVVVVAVVVVEYGVSLYFSKHGTYMFIIMYVYV